MSRLAVVVPIKAFERAKMRMAPTLDASQRRTLARQLAAGVLTAVADHDPWVVCDDETVRGFAADHDARVVWAPGTDLNGAVTVAVDQLGARGVHTAVIVHADLPHPEGLARLIATVSAATRAEPRSAALVPDREGRGTNVLAVPAKAGFRFAYGPDSCARHQEEATRLGLALTLVRDPDLGLDLDRPADLAAARPGTAPLTSPPVPPTTVRSDIRERTD